VFLFLRISNRFRDIDPFSLFLSFFWAGRNLPPFPPRVPLRHGIPFFIILSSFVGFPIRVFPPGVLWFNAPLRKRLPFSEIGENLESFFWMNLRLVDGFPQKTRGIFFLCQLSSHFVFPSFFRGSVFASRIFSPLADMVPVFISSLPADPPRSVFF